MGLNRQNSMFYDVYNALRRRREATQSMTVEINNLKQNINVSMLKEDLQIPVDCAIRKYEIPSHPLNETAALRITLQKKGSEILLFKGQWIRTPMGAGQILCIQPDDEKITLQLSFGKMYANIRRAVCWGRIGKSSHILDLHSDVELSQKWEMLHNTGSFSLMKEVSRGIQDLAGLGIEDALTDNDDDSANDESSPNNIADDENASDHLNYDDTRCPLQPISSDTTLRAADTSTSSSLSVPKDLPVPMEEVQNSIPEVPVSFPLKGFPSSVSSSSSSASSVSSCFYATGMSSSTKLIEDSSKMTLSRDAINRFLKATCRSHRDQGTLPMIFAPSGTDSSFLS